MKSLFLNEVRKFFLTLLPLLLIGLFLTGCEKTELDRQMQALCQKDGGVQVYEKVLLPESMFDESGYPFPGWRDRPKSEKLGKDYDYAREEMILKDGEPFKGQGRLTKSNIKIYRKSDRKLLGESISYGRAGGDGIVLGHPTTNSCPATGGPIEKSVFVKS